MKSRTEKQKKEAIPDHNQKDSAKQTSADTTLTPGKIIHAYKDRTASNDSIRNAQKTNTLPAGKSGIVFRVQFAMSESEPNLQTPKYKDLESLWYYKAANMYKITSGCFVNPEEAVIHQKKIREAGYQDAFVVALKNNQRIDFKEAVKQKKRRFFALALTPVVTCDQWCTGVSG